MTISDEELLRAAKDVRLRAHAPYSGYHVGVAVLDEHGRDALGATVQLTLDDRRLSRTARSGFPSRIHARAAPRRSPESCSSFAEGLKSAVKGRGLFLMLSLLGLLLVYPSIERGPNATAATAPVRPLR